MNEPVRSKHGGLWTATAIAAAVLLAVYVGSYLVLTEKVHWLTPPGTGTAATRECRFPWTAGLYRPLAAVEEAITGENVSIH